MKAFTLMHLDMDKLHEDFRKLPNFPEAEDGGYYKTDEVALLIGKGHALLMRNDFTGQKDVDGKLRFEFYYHRDPQPGKNWAFGMFPEFTITMDSMDLIPYMTVPVNIPMWTHYWGIKARVCSNYNEFVREAAELGLHAGNFPMWGEGR